MNSLFNINVCRACMQNDQSCDLMSDKALLEKFEYTTRLQIATEDNLPKAICSRCTVRLKVAYHFIKTAHESANNLKNFLEKISSEFKEVTQGSKSCKKFSNEQHFTEDEYLYLMGEENQEEISTSVDANDKNTKNYKTELADKNLNVNDIKNEDLNNCKNGTGYSFSKDILLIDASNEMDNAYENNSHLMEISTQDDEGEKCYSEEVGESNELESTQTYTSINMLESNDETDIRCQSTELAIEESVVNREYDMIVNSQDGTIQCQSIYIDESSVERTSQQNEDDDFNINNSNDEDEDRHSKKDEILGNEEIETKTFYKSGNTVYRFYCDKCNRDFSTKTNLNRHMQSHEGNKPFSCTECKKSFTQKSTLKQHMYIHTGERPYVCEVCNRGFTQCKSLIFHMRRHTGEKPFHCEYCLITFRQKDALRIHILKHHVVVERTMDGNEIFSCIICQKKFETKVEFKTHMKIHTATGEVDNVVEFFQDEEEKSTTKITKIVCNTTFTDPECFNAAVVNVSASSAAEPSRAKKFQCRKCFKCFALKKSLVRHMRIHYVKKEDLLECFECDLQFSSVQNYQEHISVCHQYACSACPLLVFKTIQELKIHMIEHDLDQQE